MSWVTASTVREGLDERLGFEPEGEHDVGDAATCEAPDQPLDHRDVPDGQHRLRNVVGERSQTRPESPDQDDRVHQLSAGASVVTGPLAGAESVDAGS